MDSVLIRNWWAVALRGALAILFGILAILMPGVTLAVMVLIFGAYSVLDGVFALVAGLGAARRHERWWHLALEGIVDLVVGVIAFVIPLATVRPLVYLVSLVSAWAIVTGVFRIAAAIRLRKEIEGEWLLGLNGALSVLFGIFVIAYQGAGLVTLGWLLGMYAMLFGYFLVTLGFRLRSHGARGASTISAAVPDIRRTPGIVIFAAILNFLSASGCFIATEVCAILFILYNPFLRQVFYHDLVQVFVAENATLGLKVLGLELILIIGAVVSALFFAASLALGFALLKGKRMSWYFQVGLAIVGLLAFPIGTVISVVILVFFFQHNIRDYFRA